MSEWRPIESAPKDGTVIGAWSARAPGLVRLVRWGKDRGIEKHAPSWLTITRGISVSNLPTHWIAVPSLPEPPKENQ